MHDRMQTTSTTQHHGDTDPAHERDHPSHITRTVTIRYVLGLLARPVGLGTCLHACMHTSSALCMLAVIKCSLAHAYKCLPNLVVGWMLVGWMLVGWMLVAGMQQQSGVMEAEQLPPGMTG